MPSPFLKSVLRHVPDLSFALLLLAALAPAAAVLLTLPTSASQTAQSQAAVPLAPAMPLLAEADPR